MIEASGDSEINTLLRENPSGCLNVLNIKDGSSVYKFAVPSFDHVAKTPKSS